jgi:hypothetical protein
MKKTLSRILMSCAMVTAIGGAAVAGNGLLFANAMAADHQAVPVISADTITAQGYTDPSAGADTTNETQAQASYQIINKANGQIIIKTLPNGDIEIVSDHTKPVFIAGTPGENDITKENAIEIARDAIVEKYALSDETLSRFTVSTDFNIVDPEQPTWHVNFLPTDQSDFSEIGNYFVTINSPSGEVVKLLSAADGVG